MSILNYPLLGILYNTKARDEFETFFKRSNTFTLGICNGCQMLASLKEMIPGASHWPSFIRNESNQFEARVVMVEITDSPSIFLNGMEGSQLPIAVAHGEGRVSFEHDLHLQEIVQTNNVALRFVDHYGHVAESQKYPFNPNGSIHGITGVTSLDGRVLAMMPHPERIIRGVSNTWGTQDDRLNWNDKSPWIRMFENAYTWILSQKK